MELNTEDSETKIYTMEQLMEMMGGYEYYSPATYGYIYNKQHGEEELAAEFLKITLAESKQANDALNNTTKLGTSISPYKHECKDEASEKPVKIRKNRSSER